jgi:hypothetical protein
MMPVMVMKMTISQSGCGNACIVLFYIELVYFGYFFKMITTSHNRGRFRVTLSFL